MGARAVAAAVVLVVMAASATPGHTKVFMTQEEAIRTAFPGGGEVKRTTAYLTEEQAAAVERASGEPLQTKVISRYSGTMASGEPATAYFDTHLVRTMPETVMIVVAGEGIIVRVDVLSFDEPQDYLPRPGWVDQFKGRVLDDELSARRGIRPITGATLTARAIVGASRRVLALHGVLSKAEVRP